MSRPPQPGIGFMPQPQQQQQPQYPSYPQPQQHHHVPQQPQYYPPQQPFPPPIQNQPPGQYYQPAMVGAGWQNGNFQSYLQNATSFHVKQKVELLEAVLGWEQENQYTVADQAGNKIFYVGEESNMCGRQCCGSRRSFKLQVKDKAGANVLVVERGLNCACCFELFCPDKLSVLTPAGQLLGSVEKQCSIFTPLFDIKNAAGATVLKIEGPLCAFSCFGSAVVFKVLNLQGVTVGSISKQWGGLVRELLTDADQFHMSFPIDLDPAIKATCMGALFLIDFQYFETARGDRQSGLRF